ncbi:MAG TPA: hypothetical protein VJQ52_02155 [Steroidobacteraceae bacterium]|nr:hypothetical protein [Steroidobacteraceae bacterium]
MGVTAGLDREAACFAEQLLAIPNTRHEAVDAAQHLQHARQARNPGFLLAPLLACGGIADRAAHGGRQALQVRLEYVVGGATVQRLDRELLADGS